MSEEHVAASGPKAEEIVEVVLSEFDRWAQHAPGQAAGVVGGDPTTGRNAAEAALADVRIQLADHLVIPIGVTIASWGGEQVQWCEEHGNWPGHRQDTTTCTIVPKLLVDI